MATETTWTSTVGIGVAFGLPLGAALGWMTSNPAAGIAGGIAGGALFGVAMRAFARTAETSSVLESGGVEAGFEPGEAVIRVGLANHFKGAEGVGGKLFLTNRRVRFRSHRFNMQVHDESYPLGEIVEVMATRTLGLIPNGLRITLADGRRERFVLYGRRAWEAEIRQAMARGAAPFRAPAP